MSIEKSSNGHGNIDADNYLDHFYLDVDSTIVRTSNDRITKIRNNAMRRSLNRT